MMTMNQVSTSTCGYICVLCCFFFFVFVFCFFFNDTATTEIYTLSLHDALPDLIAVRWLSRVKVIVSIFDDYMV